MEAKAIRERWATTPEQRQRALDRLYGILDNPASDPRVIVSAVRALIAADAQSLAWFEHELKRKQIEGDKPFSLVDVARRMAAKFGGGGHGVDGDGPPPVP